LKIGATIWWTQGLTEHSPRDGTMCLLGFVVVEESIEGHGCILADDAAPGLAVTRLDLQNAGHRLPHLRLALPDVQHGDVHEGHLDRPIGPQLDVVHRPLV